MKRPATNKKRPGNDLQWARNDLKQATTSKNVKNINKSQDSRERESLFFFASLYHFQPLHKSFNLQRLQLWERFNDERGRRKWIQEPHYIPTFFYIKIFIQVNKGAGSLDLLLNISFQPSIIAVKHSIIKVDVTELLDLPQVFTCWES